MANCRLCEHCHGQVMQGDHTEIRNGYSYHKDCLKCYVCSETDLHNAEVFKGVIFCRSCTKRIFASCVLVREDKRLMGQRGDEALCGSEEPRRRNRRLRNEQIGYNSGAYAAANNDCKPRRSTNTSTSSLGSFKTSISFNKDTPHENGRVDIGVVTEVTQTLIDASFNDSLLMLEYIKKLSAIYAPPESVNPKQRNRLISDELRMAELGASTEVANLPLHGYRVPEFPHEVKGRPAIIINSSKSNEEQHSKSAMRPDSKNKHRRSRRHHVSTNAQPKLRYCQTKNRTRLPSAKSKERDESFIDSFHSADTSLPLRRSHHHQHRHRYRRRNLRECNSSELSLRDFAGVMKIPYKLFKKNIIRRSSVMSYLSQRRHHNESFEKKRNLFRNSDDIYNNQRHGLRILYAAINHKKTPYKLGWLNLKSKTSCCIKSGDCIVHPPRCRHYRRSHTYRCMRRKVMKMAGPTKGQLSEFRGSVLRKIVPAQLANFLSYMSNYANTTTKSAGVPSESMS